MRSLCPVEQGSGSALGRQAGRNRQEARDRDQRRGMAQRAPDRATAV